MPHKTLSGRNSQACWNFERAVAEAYRKAGFKKAKRIVRGSDFGASRPDITVPEVPEMVIDAKYKNGGWRHHGVFKTEIHERYIKDQPGHPFGVMHTKAGKEVGSFVTVTLDTWLSLLQRAFLRSAKRRDWCCPRCQGSVVKQGKPVPNLVSYACNSCELIFLSEDSDAPAADP